MREFRSGVNVSRLSLRSLTYRLARPFGLSAPRPAAGSPQPLAASTLQTRCVLTGPFVQPRRQSPLPSRSFSLPRDQSVRLTTRPFGPPSGLARSSFAPRGVLFLSKRPGSSFPIRYVSVSLLFLKPLGTFLTMPVSRRAVNGFFVPSRSFSTISLDSISNTLQRNGAEFPVNKTWTRRRVCEYPSRI